MHSAIGLSLLSGAFAFAKDTIEHIPQQAILQNACQPGSIFADEKCRSPFFASSIVPSTFTLSSNISQPSQSLQEARLTATQNPDFPWSFWPECFTTDNEEHEEPFCVFSNQGFARGRGVFLVTTKTNAYAMLDKPAFKNPQVLDHVNRYESPPFIEHEFPGKGRGLVANKTLHRGDRIFASTPILITENSAVNLPDNERFALLYRGVETLPPQTQERFWRLMGHFNGDPVEDRIGTNVFEVTIDDVHHQALFPEIAMMNHDCRPNAAYAFDEEFLTHYVHAIRDIYAGEEITITYTDYEQSSDTRMKKLEKTWGFKCACSACTAHPSIVAESDSRLAQIAELDDLLDDWTDKSTATPEHAELLVTLLKQERLDASLASAYKHAAEVYSSFGKKWEAIKYARLSAEMTMLDSGFADSDVKAMQRMSQNPEMTWSWKKRVGLSKSPCTCGHAH